MRMKRYFLALMVVAFYAPRLCGTVAVKADFEWAVIGAGPAGISVVGMLRDLGIDGKKIAWVDPEFNVGRLAMYADVPANSTMGSFIDFLGACKIFRELSCPELDILSSYDPDKTYPLGAMIEPLQVITNHLGATVVPFKNLLKSLDFDGDVWQVTVDGKQFSAERVVLATGSHPRSLNYPVDAEIPLDQALNPVQLAHYVTPQDSVAVVGSAHSAVLIMKALTEIGVARIINFYSKPLQYAHETELGTINNRFGLKGTAAEWARNVLEMNPPANLIRFFNTEATRAAWLPVCNKIIYAIGYQRNHLPQINGVAHDGAYDSSTGVIAPHLFGIGIAFPESCVDMGGVMGHRVGLNSFMEYAQRVVPEWQFKDLCTRFKSFESFFQIELL